MILQMGRRKQTILKRSGLFALGHKTSPMEILTEKKGAQTQSMVFKWAQGKEQESDLYSVRLAAYKYWKKDTGGERKQANGAFERWHT